MFFINSVLMGNEESHYPKIDVEDETVEVTDNWSLYYGKNSDDSPCVYSVFISQIKNGQSSVKPLERFAKNLMIHRHPCIVKYISSWTKNNKFHLVTEEVKPLALVLTNLSPLEICIGLYNVLTALIFLHEKAKSSHNNVCKASVYVTPEGFWKLGGLEYLKKFSDVTSSYLQEMRVNRYEKAIPPEEDSNGKINAEAIDKYAFGVLVDDLLKKKSSGEIPFLSEFKEFCKKNLLLSDPEKRVSLSEVLTHQFFNHDFIRISRFLFDLPLKTTFEKEQFFSELTEQLYTLPEDVIGSQLISLLLSRVVFLDGAAQKHLLPVVLRPRNDDKQTRVALFTEDVFKRYVVPKLLQIFCVRDAQIRLILLNNFHLFCDMFTREQLRTQVLPELLVGIKDVDDQLVSMTLKALAQLVLILGASTVIGGNRGKLFTDGRPKSQVTVTCEGSKERTKDENGKIQTKTTTAAAVAATGVLFGGESVLPERPSPDGGEDFSASTTAEEVEGDGENWSDWDSPEDREQSLMATEERVPEVEVKPIAEVRRKSEEMVAVDRSLPDITTLDIKSSANEESTANGEIDFFHDMEPVISKTPVLSINTSKTKFDVESDEVASNWEGWGEEWESEVETSK